MPLLPIKKSNGLSSSDPEISTRLRDGLIVFSSENILDRMILNEPFKTDTFAIFLIRKGVLNLQYNFTSYTLQADSIFFTSPSSLYEIEKISPDIHFIGVSFHQTYLQKQGIHFTSSETLYLLSEDTKPHLTLKSEEFKSLYFSIKSLGRKSLLPAETPFLKEILHHAFLSVMYDAASLFSRHNQLRDIRLNRAEELTGNFLDLLLLHFKKERSVQFYADALFITARHLSQVVKETTGRTAGELIDEAVVKEAKVLLSIPSVNIAQVTEALEFSNQSFFGKYFKKHTGFTPSMYRANCRISNNPPF